MPDATQNPEQWLCSIESINAERDRQSFPSMSGAFGRVSDFAIYGPTEYTITLRSFDAPPPALLDALNGAGGGRIRQSLPIVAVSLPTQQAVRTQLTSEQLQARGLNPTRLYDQLDD